MHLLVLLSIVVSLCSARTVQWTGAGGNGLWNNAGNWDCSCLPTIDDDVVIDIAAIPGNVQIGGIDAPALAHSLTIGGKSRFSQTLKVNGPLTVGTGKSTLYSNGFIILQASPNAPFLNSGMFTFQANGFIFQTGVLGGPGTFYFPPSATLNLTSNAAKQISAAVVVEGKIATDSATSLVISLGGNLMIPGTFQTSNSLTISTDATSAMNVKGTFAFEGPVLNLQGNDYMFVNWKMGAGTATITNSLTAENLVFTDKGTVTLVGAPSDKRTITSVTGAYGSFSVSGGENYFGNLNANNFIITGGSVEVKTGSVSHLTLRGAFISGGKLSVGSSTLASGFISGGLVITTSSLDAEGVISVTGDGTRVVLTGEGRILQDSQLTLTGGSVFEITSSGTLSQKANFQIVEGPSPTSEPRVIINGAFISSSTGVVSGVPVYGSGSFSLSSTSRWTLNNRAFNVSTFLNNGQVSLSGVNFTSPVVSGTGSFMGNPNPFWVSSLTTNSFDLTSGLLRFNNASIGTLSLEDGTVDVRDTARVTNFNFMRGRLSGPGSSKATVVVKKTTSITTQGPQFLEGIVIQTSVLVLRCGKQQCQLIMTDAEVSTLTTLD